MEPGAALDLDMSQSNLQWRGRWVGSLGIHGKLESLDIGIHDRDRAVGLEYHGTHRVHAGNTGSPDHGLDLTLVTRVL